MKRIASSRVMVLAIALTLLTGCNSTKSIYQKGVAAQDSGNYDEAIELFTQAGEYEDAQERLTECEHLRDVANDKTAPSITGLEERIDITCGTSYNVRDYIEENIKISDNLTDPITDYSISGDEVFDRGTGKIDTMKNGEHEITVTAKDEAGNEGKAVITLSINPVVVSVDDPNPVIYDGEYATVKVKSFKHGEVLEHSDIYGYVVKFEVENKCDEPIEVYWSSLTSINRYQADASYLISPIGPGNIGTQTSYIEDKSIPEEVGDFSQIDAIVGIRRDSDEESFIKIPTTFYTDAAETD